MTSEEGTVLTKREKARVVVRDFVYTRIPITYWLPRYRFKENFVNDLMAGLTIGCLHITQGMAFAMLAHVEPIMGLYTSCFPVFIYCVFGTAVQSSFGTVSVTSLLVGDTIDEVKEMNYSPEELAEVITFLVGSFYVIASVISFHVISKLFTKYMTSAFMVGCAFQIIMKTLKLLLGLSVKQYSGYFAFIYNAYYTFRVITETNLITLGISLSILTVLAINTFVIIPQMKKVTRIILPIELLVMIVITTLSYTLGFQRFSIDLLGHVPTGFPHAALPKFPLAEYIWVGSIAIACVNFATTLSLLLVFNPEVSVSQELLALAMCNTICCNFHTIPLGNSMMRTALALNIGKKTLLADIISSVLVLTAIAFMGPIFSPLPLCALGCIIVYGLAMLIVNESKKLPSMFQNGWENGVVWVITGLVTLFISIELGLLIGLLLTLRQYLSNSEIKEPPKKEPPVPVPVVPQNGRNQSAAPRK